jgi:DNA anti-recombination protein RmuC
MEALLEKEGRVESWNDERLDELSRRTDAGFEKTATKEEMNLRFDAVDQRFDAVSQRFDAVDQRFDAVNQRFDEVDRRFDEVGKRFDAVDSQFRHVIDRLDRTNHTLFVGACGVVAAVIANGIFG